MACQCFLTGAGYVALAAVAYRLLTIVSNILGPYVLLSPIDLKKRAGASWAGWYFTREWCDALSVITQTSKSLQRTDN